MKYALVEPYQGSLRVLQSFETLEELRDFEKKHDIKNDIVKILDVNKIVHYNNIIDYAEYYRKWSSNLQKLDKGEITQEDFNNVKREIQHNEKEDIKRLHDIESGNYNPKINLEDFYNEDE
jgi:hypothetical protein